MRKSSILWLLLLIVWIILGVFLCKKYLCGLAGAATVGEATEEVKKDIAPKSALASLGAWMFKDGSLSHKSDDYIQFNRSSFNHVTPLGVGSTDALRKTAEYLKGHPDRSLLITGYYHKDEINNSIQPNLGLARANDIKNALVGLGTPSQQLSLQGKLLPANWFQGDLLRKGIDFSFNKFAVATDKLNAIKGRLLGKPLTLYFGTNEDNINLSSQQRNDFSDLIYYLDNVSASKLHIGGHTDNQGNKQYNYKLSKERAEFVKNYLTSKGGISTNRMAVKGYGPDKPVDSNSSNEGRAKNRRVEVTLK